MTIQIKKNILNEFAVSNLRNKAINVSTTFNFKFINESTKVEQLLDLVAVVDANVFTFTITEGTDIDFDYLGSYNYEISQDAILLCEGKMKVGEVTYPQPSTPTAIDGETYAVYGE